MHNMDLVTFNFFHQGERGEGDRRRERGREKRKGEGERGWGEGGMVREKEGGITSISRAMPSVAGCLAARCPG